MKCPFCGNEMKEGTPIPAADMSSGRAWMPKAGKRNTFWQRAIWAVPNGGAPCVECRKVLLDIEQF